MMARENQTEWLADLIEEHRVSEDNQVVLLGKSFKAESNLTVGSPATLLSNILKERGINPIMYDPHLDDEVPAFEENSVFLISTKHNEFENMTLPLGSIVLDPWRYREEQEGTTVIRIGE